MALNPQILVWARETAGLSVDEAAHALGFRDTRERTAAERLQAIEAGREEPSRSALLKMSQSYRRSLLVFYLSEPPRTGDRGQDFRRTPGAKPPEYDPTLDALIRDLRGRQSIAKDLVEQTEAGPVDYVGSARMDISPAELARRIAQRLEFSLEEFRRQAKVPEAFRYLRERVEASGVYVLLLGNLGNYRTNIPGSVFRGYAIADPVAPFIVVNDQDAPVAWAFTVLHELVHIWLGATGLSGGAVAEQLEVYCNQVAGEIVLPERDMRVLQIPRHMSLRETVEAIAEFASQRHISRPMVAYRLLRLGMISHARWRELDRYYEDEWRATQARDEGREKSEGGPSYYVVKRHRLGHALLELVKNSLAEGFLTHTRAGQLLGVKPRNVDPLIYAAGMRGGQ